MDKEPPSINDEKTREPPSPGPGQGDRGVSPKRAWLVFFHVMTFVALGALAYLMMGWRFYLDDVSDYWGDLKLAVNLFLEPLDGGYKIIRSLFWWIPNGLRELGLVTLFLSLPFLIYRNQGEKHLAAKFADRFILVSVYIFVLAGVDVSLDGKYSIVNALTGAVFLPAVYYSACAFVLLFCKNEDFETKRHQRFKYFGWISGLIALLAFYGWKTTDAERGPDAGVYWRMAILIAVLYALLIWKRRHVSKVLKGARAYSETGDRRQESEVDRARHSTIDASGPVSQ